MEVMQVWPQGGIEEGSWEREGRARERMERYVGSILCYGYRKDSYQLLKRRLPCLAIEDALEKCVYCSRLGLSYTDCTAGLIAS